MVMPTVTPTGTFPPSEYVNEEGEPVALTWCVPPVPFTTDVILGLVIVGGFVTVSVKSCFVAGVSSLLTVIIKG